jgi:hypothetical protein
MKQIERNGPEDSADDPGDPGELATGVLGTAGYRADEVTTPI